MVPATRIYTNFIIDDKNAFVDKFHAIMLKILKIPDYDRLVIIDEKSETFFQPTNTDGNYILFEIALFSGRSADTKRKLYAELIKFCVEEDIQKSNVRIILNETDKINWGIRGGIAASDIDLGFSSSI